MKFLKPLPTRPKYWEDLEKALIKEWKRLFYAPLIKEIGASERILQNTLDDLLTAIRNGKIQYVRGHFEGAFNSVLSKELKRLGAEWDRTHGWWKIPNSKLTPDVRMAIGISESKFKEMAARVDKKLSSVVPTELADQFKLEKIFDSTIYSFNKDFEASVKSISVKVQLTKEQREKIRKEYTENMKLYVRKWTEDEIIKLRKQVQSNVSAGMRYEGLVKIIKDSKRVSDNKAQFLARQETNLLLTEMRKQRYTDVGVNKYKWVTLHDDKVRHRHRQLDGKVISWDNPPIVTEPGEAVRRAHAGADFNCRCIAHPVIE